MHKTTLFVLCCITALFAYDTLINVEPYSGGIICMEKDHIGSITFSCGFYLYINDFMYAPSMSPEHFGGFYFRDTFNTITSIHYEFKNDLFIDTSYWLESYDGRIIEGMYKSTENASSNWMQALTLPDSLTGCDSVVTKIDTATADSVVFGRLRVLYRIQDVQNDPSPEYVIRPGYNGIFYVKTKNVNLKLQVSEIIINNAFQYVDTIYVKWAADSLGNGLFKYGTTEITNEVPKVTYVKVPQKLSRIYTVFGREVQGFLPPGVYILQHRSYLRKITLTRSYRHPDLLHKKYPLRNNNW